MQNNNNLEEINKSLGYFKEHPYIDVMKEQMASLVENVKKDKKTIKKEKERKEVNELINNVGKEDFEKMYSRMHTPWINKYKNIRPNDLCPCGSGKKFKKCCMYKLNDMEKYSKG